MNFLWKSFFLASADVFLKLVMSPAKLQGLSNRTLFFASSSTQLLEEAPAHNCWRKRRRAFGWKAPGISAAHISHSERERSPKTMKASSATKLYLKEVTSSILFFTLFLGLLTVFSTPVGQWAGHFGGSYLFDAIASNSFNGNPSLALSLYLLGDNLDLTLIRVAAQITAGAIAFRFMKTVLPTSIGSNLGCPNPAEGFDLHTAYLNEIAVTMGLILVILLVSSLKLNKHYNIWIIGLAVRLLLSAGTYTGCGMNPMIGVACLSEPGMRQTHVSATDYFNIYCTMPMLAAVMAAGVYSFSKHVHTHVWRPELAKGAEVATVAKEKGD
jgi:glycerol uptake facilitator-like aquaporin